MAERADHFADLVGDRRLDLAGLARPHVGGERLAGVLDRARDVAGKRLDVGHRILDAEAEGAVRRRGRRGGRRGGRGFRRGRWFGGRRGRWRLGGGLDDGRGFGDQGSGFADLRRGRRRGRGRDDRCGPGSDGGGRRRGRLLASAWFGGAARLCRAQVSPRRFFARASAGFRIEAGSTAVSGGSDGRR